MSSGATAQASYLLDLAAHYTDNRLSCESIRGSGLSLQLAACWRAVVAPNSVAAAEPSCSCAARRGPLTAGRRATGMSEPQIIESLTAVKGIGRWTAGPTSEHLHELMPCGHELSVLMDAVTWTHRAKRQTVSIAVSFNSADEVWPATDMFAMFSMGRPDVLPVGDLGVRQGFKLHFRLQVRTPHC